MAQIGAKPTGPSGLERRFATKGSGPYFYMIEHWMERGVAVEFGADYFSASGARTFRRWYGVIWEVTQDELVLIEADNSRDALDAAALLGKVY